MVSSDSRLRLAHQIRCAICSYLRLIIAVCVLALCFLAALMKNWRSYFYLILFLSLFVNKKQPIFILISIFLLVGLFWTQKRRTFGAAPRGRPACNFHGLT